MQYSKGLSTSGELLGNAVETSLLENFSSCSFSLNRFVVKKNISVEQAQRKFTLILRKNLLICANTFCL